MWASLALWVTVIAVCWKIPEQQIIFRKLSQQLEIAFFIVQRVNLSTIKITVCVCFHALSVQFSSWMCFHNACKEEQCPPNDSPANRNLEDNYLVWISNDLNVIQTVFDVIQNVFDVMQNVLMVSKLLSMLSN